jgi:hypothetical protein
MFTHLDRSILLTGVLAPPILINGNKPLKTQSYSVGMKQDINQDHLYLQGGPGKGVAEFKGKIISGSIEFFPRINESNQLENSILDIIDVAQNYTQYLTLTTLLLPYNATITPDRDTYISSTNSFVFDTCLIEKISIVGKNTGEITISVDILGQSDADNTAHISLPADESGIYRKLSWYDCFFQRDGSQLENLIDFELIIIKELDQRYFLIPATNIDRFDRPYSTGVKSVEVRFKYTEEITSIYDIFSFAFGGWLDGANISGNFGPITFSIPDATYKISVENLDASIIHRVTEGFYKMRPDLPNTNDFLITIS